MEKVKIEKDIYVRDEYGTRIRLYVAGQEIERYKYDEAFRLTVPVNPEDLPVVPEYRGTESLNGRVLEENKVLFPEAFEGGEVPVEAEEKSAGDEVVEAIKEAEAEKEVEETPKNKKKGK